MSPDERPVIFDADSDLWSAVREGLVVSSDLSPSLRLKVTPVSSAFSGGSSLEPPTVSTSPPSFRGGGTRSVAIQTDPDDTEQALQQRLRLADRIIELLAIYRHHEEDKENRR